MNYTLQNHPNLPRDIHLAFSSVEKGLSEEDLQSEELEEFLKLKNDNRQQEFLSTRKLLRTVWNDLKDTDHDLTILKDEYGKPYGQYSSQKMYLSLAHSGQQLLGGISEKRDIGIDLEPADREVNPHLGKRMYHTKETEAVRSLPLIRLWTIKESLVKLYGGGLRTNLNDVEVTRQSEHEFTGRFDNDKTAIICSFQHDEHWLSVAYYQKF